MRKQDSGSLKVELELDYGRWVRVWGNGAPRGRKEPSQRLKGKRTYRMVGKSCSVAGGMRQRQNSDM